MNLKKIMTYSFLCLCLMNMQCNDDDITVTPCGTDVIVDNDIYEIAESDYYTIGDIVINDDCLTVTISASGCDPNNWEMTLIDSEAIAESMPPQRYLKLTTYTNEACLAVFNKEETFDLRPLRLDGVNEVLLNIEGVEELISYTY